MTELYHTDQTPQPRQPRRVKKFPPAKPGYKYCCDCETELPTDRFPVQGTRPRSYCIECSRGRDRKRNQSYKRERRYTPHRSPKIVYPREGYKTCPDCERELTLESFPLRGSKHVGACYECTRARDRERNRLRRPTNNPRKRLPDAEIPAKVFSTQQCSICGEIKPLPMFELVKSSHEERSHECRECANTRRKASIVQQSLFFRVCSDCGVEKSLSEDFYSTNGKPGYICKDCEKKNSLQWYYDHPEQVKKRILRRQSDPAYIGYHREKARERYQTVPEAKLQAREAGKRRKEKKRGTRTERVSYKRIIERDGYCCYICSKTIDPSVKSGPNKLVFDHVIPLHPRIGDPQGTHTIDNIRPAHQICNARKSNKPLQSLTALDRQGPM